MRGRGKWQGRGDIAAARPLWIPAFAGMTGHPLRSLRSASPYAARRGGFRLAAVLPLAPSWRRGNNVGELAFELAAFYEVVEEVGVGF